MKFINALVEIGRHKGLKILAACGVPVRVRPRAPSNYIGWMILIKLSFHRQGKLEEVEKIYFDILKDKNNPEILQLLVL